MNEQEDPRTQIKQHRSRRTDKQDGTQAPALQRPTNDDKRAWKIYWNTQGQLWRTDPEIDIKRQKYLAERYSIIPIIEQNIYPFKGVKLSRADVEYLVQYHHNIYGRLAFEIGEPAKGLDLRGADLRDLDLSRLPLIQARCGLRSADWYNSTVEQREAAATHFEGTDLSKSNLLAALLRSAHFEEANLKYAHLEGAHLQGAHLQGADLRNVSFNSETNLEEINLGNEMYGYVQIADINWNGVNLAVVNWDRLKMLGDEAEAHLLKTQQRKKQSRVEQLNKYKVAVRANRQLATALQAQGLNEDAAHFSYRAQRLQRTVLQLQGLQPKAKLSQRIRKLASYAFSLFLDLLAGYGYHPAKSFFWYLIVICLFAAAYFAFGHVPMFPDALAFSLMSFHGRGFFPNLSSETNLHDILVVLAAIEAIIGLLIEISFIATFTQRFFGK